ncbi:MAG: 5-(carboxyamino)imidazole ribonucleotide mutase [Firmicutes bacterium]|nr:5-(carboxyamino)imidazole ribonucleotide mutase [Bacillota bacterium]
MDASRDKPLVTLVVGSDSDLPVIGEAARTLEAFGIGFELFIASAHRSPERVREIVRSAEAKGTAVIIAAAGLSAHLPGAISSLTTLPVIGVPVKSGPLNGVDALYSIVQMPPGVPVATVGIDAAVNAAILAVEILAAGGGSGVDAGVLRARLAEHRRQMAESVAKKDAELHSAGRTAPERAGR